jgi:flagellar hook-associated protein FlgK
MEELSSILDINITFNRIGHAEISTNGISLLSGNQITYIGLRFTGHGTDFVEPVIGHNVGPNSGILAFDPTFRNATSILRFDREPHNYERPGLLLGLVTSRGLGGVHHASQFTENPYETDPNFAPLDAYALFQWQARRDFNANIAIIPRTMRHLDISFNHMVTMINEFITNQNASTDRSTWGFWNDPTADPNDATVNMITDPNRQQTGIPLFVTRDPDLIQNADSSQNSFTLNYTLGNVIINPDLLAPGGYAYLGFSRNSLDIDDTTVIQNLLAAWQYNNVSIDGSLEMNVDNIWNHIITHLATETKALSDASYNQDHRLRNLDTARQASFGVSLDEELSNMMRFQHSFNAAARLVNIIDSMIDTVVNRTGRVGM